MNNFTYENTKDATHVAMCLAGFPGHQFYNNIAASSFGFISEHTNFSWMVIHDRPSYELIELSRPHNETAAYWTNEDGDVQYAQGNKMNTNNLIPISYVKKFTPLVAGDVVVNNKTKFEMKLEFDIDTAWNVDDLDDLWSLKSFADRPNTGTQPVGDDVVVYVDDKINVDRPKFAGLLIGSLM